MRIINSVATAVACSMLAWMGQSCSQGSDDRATDTLTSEHFSSSPVLSPAESIKKMQIEEGFAVEIIAAEPLVTAPVAMSFDTKGRIWVVQMNDYMPDTAGTGEDKPTGKVVILSDKNRDGVMDDKQIFLDSLVLPRAICFIEDGILVAEPPNLWFYKIENDKPVKKTLVDSTYAQGGNVEHQANGLLRALDNWIYSAKSDKRYRKKGDRWLIEKTHFRGQWGISQDDYGRLFYNNNSENLLGDEFAPGLGAGNKNQKSVKGFNKRIVPDNKVYPVRPTTGVNRGYMKGVLDSNLRLVNFTAACGPVIYNGGLFDREYQGNAFVAEPSANLIKRNILEDKGYEVLGKQAYSGREFIASEDERFRPVNLSVGPDGALYVVDMYRGIIQHKTYLTPYLKNEIRDRSLAKPLTCGRIYRIAPKGAKRATTIVAIDSASLLENLQHENAWIRNKAQQLLVDGKHVAAATSLRNLSKASEKPIAAIHALWTLEGLGLLNDKDVLPLLQQSSWPIRMQALSVLPSVLTKNNYRQFVPGLQSMIDNRDTLAAPYVAFLISKLQSIDKIAADQLLVNLTKNYGGNLYVAEAIISNLQNREADFFKRSLKINPDTSIAINKRLKKVLADINAVKNASSADKLKREYPRGSALFNTICQTCHGADGNGVASLAPPLNKSEWVVGDKNKLISIVLYGLTGPVSVNGKLYKAPEINGDMPGIFENKEMSDDDIAELLNFVRNSWNNKAPKVDARDILFVRERNKERQNAYTVEELKKLK